MYEDMTFEALTKRALSRVSQTLDKREGSMVYNGVAPSMAELAQLYIGLDYVFKATYLLTAPREYLILRASDRGYAPYQATAAEFRAVFNVAVPNGTRFSLEKLNFVVTGRIAHDTDTPTRLSHRLVCESAGSIANGSAGTLIPVEYVDGLTLAELVELLIPGTDDEETEAFRSRVLDSFRTRAFGGNRADYAEKVKAIAGVGAVKVRPVWNGDIDPASLIPGADVSAWYAATVGSLSPAVASWLTAVYNAAHDKKLTVGGTVRLVIMAANNTAPTQTLINAVQTAIDPTQNAGEGVGLAPIGHVVSVVGVIEEQVNVSTTLSFDSGWDWPAAKSYVESAIDSYFADLAGGWADTDHLIVRISQLESRVLADCAGMVNDISGTTLNGVAQNLALGADSIPVRGDVHG